VAYATTSDVQARLPGFTLNTTSKPTLAETTQWLVEADAMLNGALLAAGLTSPNTNAHGVEILKAWTADYAEAHVRMARASAGGDGTNDDGKDQLQAFRDLLLDIRKNPTTYGEMLEGGAAPAAARHMRGYALDNDDDVDVEDLAPTFTRSAGEDQW